MILHLTGYRCAKFKIGKGKKIKYIHVKYKNPNIILLYTDVKFPFTLLIIQRERCKHFEGLVFKENLVADGRGQGGGGVQAGRRGGTLLQHHLQVRIYPDLYGPFIKELRKYSNV